MEDKIVVCVCFGITYTKIGTIQRRLAWPLRKDDTQIREAFQIFWQINSTIFLILKMIWLRIAAKITQPGSA